MAEPIKSSFAATALKTVLIFGAGAAAWAFLQRWLNKEEEAEAPSLMPGFPMTNGMPQFVPMPYPFAVPQMQALPPPPPAHAIAIVDEEQVSSRKSRNQAPTARRRYADMDADEVFENELEKIRKRRAKMRAHDLVEEEDAYNEVMDN